MLAQSIGLLTTKSALVRSSGFSLPGLGAAWLNSKPLILLVPVVGFVASAMLLFLAPGLAITSRFGGNSDWLVRRLRRRPS